MFVSIYLFSFAEMRQVLKFPNFIEHYLAHKITDRSTSVFSFLKMHYLNDHPVDADYQQDMKLPFKTHEANTFVSNPLIIPENFSFALTPPRFFTVKSHIYSHSSHYASNLLGSIFRPPILV